MKKARIGECLFNAVLSILIIITICTTLAYASSFHANQEAIDIARQYIGDSNPSSSGECKGFVSFVYDKAFGISIPKTAADGGQWLPWCDDINQVAHYDANSASENNSQYNDMTDFFKSVWPGDALQMSGNPYPHTMIVLEIHWDDWGGINYITVIDANWSSDYDNKVREHSLSFSDLSAFMTDAGMTAYRYRYATN